jgi:hypothetical protein
MKLIAGRVEDENGMGDFLEMSKRRKRAIVPHFFKDAVISTLKEGENRLGDGRVLSEEGLECGISGKFLFRLPSGLGGKGEMSGLWRVEPGGAEKNHFFDSLGVAQSKVERDACAHGEAAEVGLIDAELIDERDHEVGKVVEGEESRIKFHGCTMSGHVGGDDVVIRKSGESGKGLAFPCPEPVEENKRFGIRGTEGIVGKRH